MDSGVRWLITSYSQRWLDGCSLITFTTDRPVHVILRWTDKEPRMHLIGMEKRGLKAMKDPYYCFVAFKDIEQYEPGDTFTHTFIWPGWAYCTLRWYYFLATADGFITPTQWGIFNKHYTSTVPPATRRYEFSGRNLGYFGNIRGAFWEANTFQTPLTTHILYSIRLKLARYQFPGWVYLSIRSTGEDGLPTGPDLSIAYTDGNTLPLSNGGQWREFILPDTIVILAGVSYSFVVRAPAGNNTNFVRARWSGTGFSDYFRGEVCASIDSGDTWTFWVPNSDLVFEEWGYTPPPPP